MTTELDKRVLSQLYSDFEDSLLAGEPTFHNKIIVDGFAGRPELDATPGDVDSKAHRRELIEAVRGGKHVALTVTARTFRQQKGKSNRRYLRLGGDLAASVPTFAKQPFLTDHTTWSSAARRGTILASRLIPETQTRVAFEQDLEVVDPDSVIRVLDGRLDRFSIGWYQLGPVMCTVHGVDILSRDSCMCWPGDTVTVDGEAKIAEYEFTIWAGKETSGVNIPAVQHTNIEDIRAALAAELHLPTRRKENAMALTRLAQALGLAALSEANEDAAIAAVENLTRRASTSEQELGGVRAQLSAAQAGIAAASAGRIDQLISLAVRDGKIRMTRDKDGRPVPSAREKTLRNVAKKEGITALEAHIAELDVIVPVGQRLASDDAVEPGTDPLDRQLAAGGPVDDAMQEVASQLGLDVKDMYKFARERGYNQEG